MYNEHQQRAMSVARGTREALLKNKRRFPTLAGTELWIAASTSSSFERQCSRHGFWMVKEVDQCSSDVMHQAIFITPSTRSVASYVAHVARLKHDSKRTDRLEKTLLNCHGGESCDVGNTSG